MIKIIAFSNKNCGNLQCGTEVVNPGILCVASYVNAGNWDLVKSIVGTKLRRSQVCLHSQTGDRLYQLAVWRLLTILIHFQNCNEMALLFFGILQECLYITETGDKIKYCRLPKNTETQQENVKQNAS